VTFTFARTPELQFGPGTIARLPEFAARYGTRLLLVIGGSSLQRSPHWPQLMAGSKARGLDVSVISVSGEPSPELVDSAVRRYQSAGIDVVAAIGGGSVIDSGKAIAAMLTIPDHSVTEYLEGLPGVQSPPGTTLPFIAAPTTAGTGSEATKNAVLAKPGEYKRSLRHDHFVPALAIIDPELACSCPPAVTAACGMDALTQLLEGLVSRGASPLSDALALSGIVRCAAFLVPAATDRGTDIATRAGMGYAAYLSGIVLANAGLGIVHGLAGPLGARFPVPHGLACGVLLPPAFAITVKALSARAPHSPALAKCAQAGTILAGGAGHPSPDLLIEQLHRLAAVMNLPKLGQFGIREEHLPALVAAAGQKTHPVQLLPDEISAILHAAL